MINIALKMKVQSFIGLLLLFNVCCCNAKTMRIDMEGFDCSKPPFEITQDDIFDVIAQPLQFRDSAAMSPDTCTVSIVAPQGQHLIISLRSAEIRDCGIEVKLFDNDKFYKYPMNPIIQCETRVGIVYRTFSNNLAIRLEKKSAQANTYNYQLRVTTNLGPPNEPSNDPAYPNTGRSGISDGAIAGMSIGILLVVAIAVIVLAVVCIKRSREPPKTSQSESSLHSTSTSGAPMVYPYPTNHSLNGSFRKSSTSTTSSAQRY